MAYISDHLTHFIGRSLGNDQQRYDLLCKIIRGGELLDPLHAGQKYPIFKVVIPWNSADGVEYSSDPSVRHDTQTKLSDNALVRFEIVCFCDIPEEDLAIHCSKYGRFGLAFSRPFLVAQGASPVMYIPKPGFVQMTIREHHSTSGVLQFEEAKTGSRSDLIDDIFKFHNRLAHLGYSKLERDFSQANSIGEVDEIVKQLRTALFYQTAVEAFMFGHLKFFDPALPHDHIDNYYMEREWRVAGRVRFSLDNVRKMFVAPAFAGRARSDFPKLADRIVPLST